MTAKEQQRMRRLELENAELRAAIANHMRVYGDTLVEIIDLKTRLELVRSAVNGEDE